MNVPIDVIGIIFRNGIIKFECVVNSGFFGHSLVNILESPEQTRKKLSFMTWNSVSIDTLE